MIDLWFAFVLVMLAGVVAFIFGAICMVGWAAEAQEQVIREWEEAHPGWYLLASDNRPLSDRARRVWQERSETILSVSNDPAVRVL